MTSPLQLLTPTPTSRLPQLSGSPTRPHRILCVDDDALALKLLGEVLTTEGYAAVLATHPIAALRTNLAHIDLALVDFNMPGLNGRELLQLIRGLRATFPIVLFSTSALSLPQPTRALFSRCIDKATPARHLLAIIEHLLATRPVPVQLS